MLFPEVRAEAGDHYCYPGTTILINKSGIKDQLELDAFEAERASRRAAEPLPPGQLSYTHYRSIHRHLFQDVYAWAGTVRTVRMSRKGNPLCPPEDIEREMKRLFAALASARFFRGSQPGWFAVQTAHFLTELNSIHPFRAGNGWTQLSFLAPLAARAGFALEADRLEPTRIMHAVRESFIGQEGPLIEAILVLIT